MRRAYRIQFITILLLCCWFGAAQSADRARVEIIGVQAEVLDNVQKFITLYQQKSHELLNDERIKKLHKKALSEIRDALQPYGYYKPTIQSDLKQDGELWIARYVIDPGPAMKISTLDLQIDDPGAQDPAFQKLVRQFPLAAGETLAHARYEEGKGALMQLATERGYFDAQFEVSEIRVDLEAYKADIVIRFHTGPRSRFGALKFNNSRFNPEFLSRYSTFKAGDPYSFTALLDLQNALTDSDYFSQVDVKPLREQDSDNTVPVEIVTVARDRSRYTMGFGYGTDTGARATFGVERRYVNEYGHRWRADLKLSEIGDSLSTRYVIPMRHPSTDLFALSAGREKQNQGDSTTTKYYLGSSVTRLDYGWQKTLFLNYERDENFSVGGQTGSSTLVMPGMNWTMIHADDRIYTTFGHRFMVEVRGGSETLGSTTSFIQARINAKFVRRFQNFGRVLVRGEAGYTEVLNFEQLPPSVRFFAGGDFSVRGYEYNSLGTRENGAVIGGTHLLVGSAEYEQILTESWSLGVFLDVGNAMDRFDEPLARGIGFGVRYRSPIGLIRFDLARPLDNLGNARYLHLSIGPDL